MPVTFLAIAMSMLMATFLVPIEGGESIVQVKSASESPSSTVSHREAITPTSTTNQVLDRALIPVCSCESTGSPHKDPMLYHYEDDGVTLLIGRVNSSDRGMCQINLGYHLKASEKMGLDILHDVDDYIFYSNWLYETQGLKPWKSSQHCWGV